jgi:hypothetical protein
MEAVFVSLTMTMPTIQGILAELRQQYPAATAQMPATKQGAVAWLNRELNALYDDPANTSNHWNRRYGINLQNALRAIEDAEQTELVGPQFGDEEPSMGFDSWDQHQDAIDADEQAALDALPDAEEIERMRLEAAEEGEEVGARG